MAACVQYANEHQIPIHARGAGTGLAGESLGPGLVIDFSHSMRRVLAIGAETVRVQPGVVHAVLNEHLLAGGRMFGPDPATSDVTTIGSMIAIDAAGSHRLRYGSCRRHVRGLQVVLGDGSVMEIDRHPIPTLALDNLVSRRDQVVGQLGALIQQRIDLIERHRPKTPANRSGYLLHDVVADGKLDLAKVVAGSEGTLALVTASPAVLSPIVAVWCSTAVI